MLITAERSKLFGSMGQLPPKFSAEIRANGTLGRKSRIPTLLL